MSPFRPVAVVFLACLPVVSESFDVVLQPGWNVISVPVDTGGSGGMDSLRAVAEGPLWEWRDGEYGVAEHVFPGHAYWLYFRGDAGRTGTVSVAGAPVREVVRRLAPGWNLVAPVGYPPYPALSLPLVCDPADAIAAAAFAWGSRGYSEVSAVGQGGGVWVYAREACTVLLTPGPRFEGVNAAYSPSAGAIHLRWPGAVDDRTGPFGMLYHVYAAPASGRGTVIDEANLVRTIPGGFDAVVEGLIPGQEYDAAVVAEDADGNRNYFGRNVLTVQALSAEPVLSAPAHNLDSPEIGVQQVFQGGNIIVVGNADGLSLGDFVVFENPEGQGLRRITSFTPMRESSPLVTEEAALSQAVHDGVLRSALVLTDAPPLIPDRGSAFGHMTPAAAARGRDLADIALKKGVLSIAPGVDLGYAIEFSPSVDTELRFQDGEPIYVRVAGSGRLRVDADLALALGSPFTKSSEDALWSKGHTFRYQVGPVPVIQDLFLIFQAKLVLSADTAVSAVLHAFAEKNLTVGFEWDQENGYRLIADSGFDSGLSVDLDGEFGVNAMLQIYPELATSFYNTARSSVFVVPTLSLDSAVRVLPEPVEMTVFDVDFRADLSAEASLEVLGIQLGWHSPAWNIVQMPLFSLPEIELNPAAVERVAGAPAEFTLTVADGVNNGVPSENILWWVEPAAGNARRIDPSLLVSADRLTASVTADEGGEFRVWAAAYGAGTQTLDLGEFGTRFAVADLAVRGVTQLTAAPSRVTLPQGAAQAYTFTVQFSDGSSTVLASGVSLSVDPASSATIAGQTVTVADDAPDGDVIVTGSYGGQSTTATLTVDGDAAAPPAQYVVIDVSAGPEAESYPVEELDGAPADLLSNAAYKTTRIVLRGLPAGTFTMGSPPGELGHAASEQVQETLHQVTLTRGFHIGVFEVTQKQWERVMGTRPSEFGAGAWEARPVEMVNYVDIRGTEEWPENPAVSADSFAGRLRARTGLQVDLPTEAQWEYACRAGTLTALNNGTNITSKECPESALPVVGWCRCNSGETSHPVGLKVPNAFGLYDMHGNVWEWTLDWYRIDLGSDPVVDPVGPDLPDHLPGGLLHRVIRGGAWKNPPWHCRAATRTPDVVTFRRDNLGFRLAVQPQ